MNNVQSFQKNKKKQTNYLLNWKTTLFKKNLWLKFKFTI